MRASLSTPLFGLLRPGFVTVAALAGTIGLGLGTASACAMTAPRTVPSTTTNLNFGAFAGEVWRGAAPREIGGSWNVPTIAANSNDGFAGTWIGIQGAATPDASQEPFIQVGVNETRSGTGALATNRYYAFFSDTAQDFKPVSLFTVTPGDAITASLSLVDQHWTVQIRDATSGRTTRFVTSQEGTGSFDQAEWLQEDATDTRTQGQVGYPVLSALAFNDLQVNGSAPPPTALDSQWMTEHDQALGPGAIGKDGFTLGHRSLSTTAQRYLQIAEPFAEVNDWFSTQAASWHPSTPQIESTDERSTLIQSIQQEIGQLQAVDWPRQVSPLIHQLISARQSETNFLQTQPRANWSAIAHWIHGFQCADITPAMRQLHRLIGVPDLLPANG